MRREVVYWEKETPNAQQKRNYGNSNPDVMLKIPILELRTWFHAEKKCKSRKDCDLK